MLRRLSRIVNHVNGKNRSRYSRDALCIATWDEFHSTGDRYMTVPGSIWLKAPGPTTIARYAGGNYAKLRMLNMGLATLTEGVGYALNATPGSLHLFKARKKPVEPLERN